MDKFEIVKLKLGESGEFGELGEGAFGTVFKAFDKETKEEFAIKVIITYGIERAQVEKEVKFLKDLHHDNIIRYREHFYIEKDEYHIDFPFLKNSLCIVMELADAGTLKDIVQKGMYSRDEKCVWNLILQLSSALAYIHGRNILHRDLTPANVLGFKTVTQNEFRWKISDFGISKILEAKSGPSNSKRKCYTYSQIFNPVLLYAAPEVNA